MSALLYDPTDFNLVVKYHSAHYAMCLCPFHSEKNASFSFNLETGDFICFSCHEAGSVSRLAYMQKVKVSQPKQRSFSPNRDDKRWKDLIYAKLAYDDSYLKARGVSNESVSYYNIVALKDAVLFPCYDLKLELQAVLLRFKHQNIHGAKYIARGKKPPIYPLHKVYDYPTHATMIVTEGVFGAIRMRQLGYNSIALLGSSVSTETVRWLKRYTQLVLFLDYDRAGLLATLKIKDEIPTATTISGHSVEADNITKNLLDYLVNYQRQVSRLAIKTMLDMVSEK